MITYWVQVTKEVFPFLPPSTYKFVFSTHSVLYSGNKEEQIIQIITYSQGLHSVCVCVGGGMWKQMKNTKTNKKTAYCDKQHYKNNTQ